jgi:DUF4097 and DUF4098 domain-containing protein YvlB
METTNGSIDWDLPLVLTSRSQSDNEVEGTLATGAGTITLKTTNGSINLKKN